MPITPSQRPTREWPLLVLALALVCTVCFFLWGWFGGHEMGGTSVASWTHERLSRLLLGPEQIACYSFFTWAAFIVLSERGGSDAKPQSPAEVAALVDPVITFLRGGLEALKEPRTTRRR